MLNFDDFLATIEPGFDDVYDVQILAFLILSRVAAAVPRALSGKLDAFIETFKKILSERVKAESVKQEYEKADEKKRSVLRVFHTIQININELELDQQGYDKGDF